jgi:hypothetical protein
MLVDREGIGGGAPIELEARGLSASITAVGCGYGGVGEG